MITLHVYMTPKPGKVDEFEAQVRDKWLAAMAEQPGFISSAVLAPFSDDALADLGAEKPSHAYEVFSIWRSERERLEWVARPIHDEVFLPLLEFAEVSFTLKNVSQSWNI